MVVAVFILQLKLNSSQHIRSLDSARSVCCWARTCPSDWTMVHRSTQMDRAPVTLSCRRYLRGIPITFVDDKSFFLATCGMLLFNLSPPASAILLECQTAISYDLGDTIHLQNPLVTKELCMIGCNEQEWEWSRYTQKCC